MMDLEGAKCGLNKVYGGKRLKTSEKRFKMELKFVYRLQRRLAMIMNSYG
jgi:hypothetical protein